MNSEYWSLNTVKSVDFPSESNTQETTCQDKHLQAASDKSLPRLLICASDRERKESFASNVMHWAVIGQNGVLAQSEKKQ